jgi:hypothetical protein
MILPAIQKKREEYSSNEAMQNLTAILAASNEYFRVRGSYPNKLSDLAQFCAASPSSCPLGQDLLSGRAGGYILSITISSEGFECIAEPESPGITGSYTLMIGPNAMVTRTPTPGADAARQRAFNDILMSGANAVVQLLALNPDATAQIRGYTESPNTVMNSLNTLDTNHDSKVSISEVNGFLTTDPTGPTYVPLKGFLDAVYRDLRLDTISGQDGNDIVVTMSDLDATQPLLFSYQGLRNLTVIDWGDGSSPNDAIAKLNAAEAAEKSGNLNRKAKFLKQYRKIIKQGSGTVLTTTNANTLIAISNAL